MYITPFRVVWAPIITTAAFAVLLMALVNVLFKNIIKAGLFTSVFLIMFFIHGDLLFVLSRYVILPRGLLAAIFLVLLVVYFINLKKQNNDNDLRVRTILFFAVGCTLILISIVFMLSFQLSNNMALKERSDAYAEINMQDPASGPDIFYIIIDGYGRQDILDDLYDYDNSAFLASLEQRGFYIARESKANYCQTSLSLASSLNMDYVDAMIADLDRESYDRRPLMDLVRDSAVRAILEEENYYLTSFFTPYSPVDINNVDNHQKRRLGLNEFSHFLINKTPLPLLFRDFQYELYRRDILYVLDNNFESLDHNRPNFVYAHSIPPHPPFVFDDQGRPLQVNRGFSLADGSHWGRDMDSYIEGYINHVEFVNTKILEMVDVILSKSEKPIIIIQSDHGPGSELDWNEADKTNFKERLSILNVYYFYDQDYDQLYDAITPVNTFRVIFNQYFGADLELLDDRSYFSTWPRPYVFYDAQ